MSDPQDPVVHPEPVGYSQPRPVAVRPKKTWLAVVLAVLLGPFGFFYVIRWYWALLIVLAELAIGFALPSGGAATSDPVAVPGGQRRRLRLPRPTAQRRRDRSQRRHGRVGRKRLVALRAPARPGH